MNQNLKILLNVYYEPVAQLKQFIEQNRDIFIPINGGASLRNHSEWCNLNLLFDDVGENISNKNSQLNELTVIYWAWKHYSEIGNPEYIGFNHYRKQFDIEQIHNYSEFDAIVGNPLPLGYYGQSVNMISQYSLMHDETDFDKFAYALKDVIPFKILCSWCIQHAMFAPQNMWIMKKDIFFEYCEKLFHIMNMLDGRLDLSGRDNYQKRAYAFLSERFTSLFFYEKNLKNKIKTVDIIQHPEWKNNGLNERGTYS